MFEATEWVHKGVTPSMASPISRYVLSILAHHANYDREAWPALRTIANETGLSLVAVIQNIQKLDKAGLITITKSKNKEGGDLCNVYTLNFDPLKYESKKAKQNRLKKAKQNSTNQRKTKGKKDGGGLRRLNQGWLNEVHPNNNKESLSLSNDKDKEESSPIGEDKDSLTNVSEVKNPVSKIANRNLRSQDFLRGDPAKPKPSPTTLRVTSSNTTDVDIPTQISNIMNRYIKTTTVKETKPSIDKARNLAVRDLMVVIYDTLKIAVEESGQDDLLLKQSKTKQWRGMTAGLIKNSILNNCKTQDELNKAVSVWTDVIKAYFQDPFWSGVAFTVPKLLNFAMGYATGKPKPKPGDTPLDNRTNGKVATPNKDDFRSVMLIHPSYLSTKQRIRFRELNAYPPDRVDIVFTDVLSLEDLSLLKEIKACIMETYYAAAKTMRRKHEHQEQETV